MDVKNLVKGTTSTLTHYSDGNLWYKIEGIEFNFPVPIEDTKGAVFNSQHKTITLMRWVRKHLDLKNSGNDY